MSKPGHEFRRYHLKSMIDSLAFEGDATREYFAFLFDVMRGKAKIKRLAREPGPHEDSASAALIPEIEDVPTFADRMNAGKEINRYYNGNAPTSVDVNVSGVVHQMRDLRAYTDLELDELERLLSKAPMLEVVASEVPIVQDALPMGETEAEIEGEK